jgi:hypothetical protein
MKIFQQLNNEELPEVILGSGQRWLQRQVGDLPDALRSAVQRPETFWQSQQAAIQSRIASGSRVSLFSMRALAQTCALALALFALALLRTGPGSVPIPAQTQSSPDSDQELLVAIEQAVQSDGPASLEPAALLAEQIANPVQGNSSSHFTKESPNENQ